MSIEQLEWECSCGDMKPPTLHHYHVLLGRLYSKEHKGHKIALKNKETGEQIAHSPRGSANKGIMLPKDFEELTKQLALEQKPPPSPEPPPPPAKTEKPVVNAVKAEPLPEKPPPKEPPPKEPPPEEPVFEEEKPKGEGKTKEMTVGSTGILTFEVSLPADAFVLFNLAKTCGREKDSEKLFDEWLWDCVKRRFDTDYKLRLILAPIEGE